MRSQVPYVGEKQLARSPADKELAKRKLGTVIDDVVATQTAESSWEDTVPADWQKAKSPVRQASVSLASGESKTMKQTVPPGAKPRAFSGKSLQPQVRSQVAASAPLRSTTIVYSDGPSLDWLPINNGHGLRINVNGNLDLQLRGEWNRLLEETRDLKLSEFEFNLGATNSLSLAGLGMLLLFRESKSSSKNHICLKNCNRDVAQLLFWTGMDKYFTIQMVQALDS